jgi:signal transduction histidine kinase
MRERARIQGGTLEVQGVTGEGTIVSLRLPLTAREEQ